MHKTFRSDEEARANGLKTGDEYTAAPTYECSDELATLLENLRNAQKGFFAAKQGTLQRQNHLKESKRLEKELDAFLLHRNAEKADTQTKLF